MLLSLFSVRGILDREQGEKANPSRRDCALLYGRPTLLLTMNNAVQLSASTEVRLRSYDLESSRSYYFYLESFPCFGRKWSLRMYADVEESVVIKLDNNSKKIIDIIEASFIVIDGRGNANGPFFLAIRCTLLGNSGAFAI